MNIFISHSSKDKKIVGNFIDNILLSGCGIDKGSIVCTSFEWSGAKQGEDIRNYLKENLKKADYVFFMISKSYLQSTICLNEMGAAWVLDIKTKPFVFPDMNLPKDLTWLYEGRQGSFLTDSYSLDEIYDELQQGSFVSTSQWNHYKSQFINYVSKHCPNIPDIDRLCPIKEPITGNFENILSPNLTEVFAGKQYSLVCKENDYDLVIHIEKIDQNNISWCYRTDSIQNWQIVKKANGDKIYLAHNSKGNIGDFRFNGQGQVKISYFIKDNDAPFNIKTIDCK